MKVLAKALENLGGGIDPKTHELSPERMQTATNEAVKTIIAGGGFIDASTLFGLSKQAGGMGRLADPGKLFDEVITSVIDQGGNRTGTALSALGRQFLGDKMTVQTATELEKLGIIDKGSWKKDGGTGIITRPGQDVHGADDIKKGDLPAFFNDIIGPAIRKQVGDDNAALMQETYKIFGQQTGQRLGLLFLQNEAQRDRDVKLRQGVDPDAVYKGIGDKDYAANLNNLGTSIQSFAQVLGGPAIPMAIGSLHVMTDAVQGLTKLAATGPNAAKALLGTVWMPSLLDAGWGVLKDVWHALPSNSQTGGGPSPHGRDPHSPQSGPYAYTPPSAPAISANLQGTATVNVANNVNVTGLVQTIMSSIKGEIEGLFRGMGAAGTNGDSGHDGRASAVYPDHMHGAH